MMGRNKFTCLAIFHFGMGNRDNFKLLMKNVIKQIMPHFDFMKDKQLDPKEESYFRSSIHIIHAEKILKNGDIQHGIAVLYDALINAIKFYLLQTQHEVHGEDHEIANLVQDLFPQNFWFEQFQQEMENAIEGNFETIDVNKRVNEVKTIIERFGIEIEQDVDRLLEKLEKL